MRLAQIVESLLFASDAPLSAADLARVDERLDEDTVEAVVQELRAEYELTERSFQVYEVAGGFQLLTRPEFVAVLERYDTVPQPSRLSAPALEVLAIIAYRQPLGRIEIEEIRGVGSSGVLRTLTERNLVEPVARGEGLGRPLLYGTTKKFLEHFGFRSLEDLPRPDELPVLLRERTGALPDDAFVGADTDAPTADTPTAAAAAATESDAVEAGAVENDAVEAGAVENDAVEAGAVENDAVEAGVVEGGAVDNDAVENDAVVAEHDAVEHDAAEEDVPVMDRVRLE
jgi:segregation and condensation protein B